MKNRLRHTALDKGFSTNFSFLICKIVKKWATSSREDSVQAVEHACPGAWHVVHVQALVVVLYQI